MGFKSTSSDVFAAVLAGFGIWAKPLQNVKNAKQVVKQNLLQMTPVSSNVYPLRVIRVKDVNPQLAGRMVISGRMADVCAELDRLAA